ncbi:hypothetical protein AAF712_005780 [Marasmius tenuissimus]|uniref:Amidohydrolase-related domain-containing protein n=1 Tax=Marasmius tenuissimus TaxID=585030 RepID=A0ABR3A0V6_9AGAR
MFSFQMVLSLRSPGIQGISDPAEAVSKAFEANSLLASLVFNNTRRFGAFAALSMHNASKAAEELRRTVEDLGFLGGLIYDYQQGPNNSTLFYDGPDYDAFWKTVTELGVPVYLHPRVNIPAIFDLLYKDAPWLGGAAQEFTTTLSNHVLRLCANGVFDRFPTAQVAVGHMGERLPSDFYRIDGTFDRWKTTVGLPMKRKLSDYWQSNIHQTSSTYFSTPLFRFHRELLGIGRILFSLGRLSLRINCPGKRVGGQSLCLTSVRSSLGFTLSTLGGAVVKSAIIVLPELSSIPTPSLLGVGLLCN